MTVDNVKLLTNGHKALELTLQAMNLQGEIITTSFTFASTTHAIVRNGLKLVFCDIDPVTYTIDSSRIENLITDRTCAIMPVHVYGNTLALHINKRVLKLPLYADLSLDDVDRICRIIIDCGKSVKIKSLGNHEKVENIKMQRGTHT